MNLKLLLTSIIWVISGTLYATPYELSYGGRLTESSGKPVSGPVTLRVTFFRSAMGNDQVGVSLPDVPNVPLQDGLFQIAISLSAADFHTLFNGSSEAYIQVEDLSHGVAYPRQRFSAVPYALKVPVDGESITYNANGELSLGNGNTTLKLPNAVGALNKVLKSDGAGALVWADDLSGGGAGTITSTEIQDGTITNADISATAAIATSKISGLGSLATKSAVGSSDIADGSVTGTDIANGTITDANINATAAISYLKISGLGGAASKNVGTAAGDVAAGNHTHTMSAVTDAGSLATKNAVGSADITDGSVTGTDLASGTITDSNVSASAAIAGTKVSPNFGSQNVSTTGTLSADTVRATTHLQTATSAGAPNATECDDPSEYGRLKTDTSNNKLYVCSASGWVVNASGSGYLSAASNLSDVASAATARTNLGLGDAATKNIGTTASDVAAGSHTHTMSAVTDAGSLATKNTVGSSDITDGSVTGTDIASGTITNSNISASAAIDNTKIAGLGSAATKNVGTAAGDVAAGNHSHADATTGASGFMSASDKVRLNAAVVTTDTGSVTSTMIADGTIVNADISSSAAIAVSKISGLGALATKSTVANGDVEDGAISLAKLSATICAANQVLKMNSGGTALTCASDAGSGSYAAKSADYTVTTSDNDTLLDVTNQTTITLPDAATAGAGFRVTIKNSGAALARIMPNGTENIDGQNVGVMLATANSSVTLMSSGSAWIIASKDGHYARTSTFSDLICGGASDYCYDDTTAMAAGYAMTPGGKALEYVVTPAGSQVWKEIGGSRVLKPTGADSWALKLNANGKGFSAVDFTSWKAIAGRVCPTNVYIDDSNKFTTDNCLYYTSEPGQGLDESGTNGTNGFAAWSTTKWYTGNVKACSDKGMRLPTLYETATTSTGNTNRPTSDGTPIYAQSTGIPSQFNSPTWTATTSGTGTSSYWYWSNTSVGNNAYGNDYGIRCTLP